jgi:autoinducer 2-degrading protein
MTDSMYTILVAINVKPEYRDPFIKASTAEAQGSVRGEPELFQFQLLVDESNPNRFYFYEIFRDETAAETHWETGVFKTWWNTVEEMLDGGTERICTMGTIFPSVSGLEKQKPGLMNW